MPSREVWERKGDCVHHSRGVRLGQWHDAARPARVSPAGASRMPAKLNRADQGDDCGLLCIESVSPECGTRLPAAGGAPHGSSGCGHYYASPAGGGEACAEVHRQGESAAGDSGGGGAVGPEGHSSEAPSRGPRQGLVQGPDCLTCMICGEDFIGTVFGGRIRHKTVSEAMQSRLKFENLLCDFLVERGYTCMRSAGSRGALDVIAFNQSFTRFIQVKSTKQLNRTGNTNVFK